MNNNNMKKIFLLLTALLWGVAVQSLWAVPAHPGWQTKTQPDGTTIEVQLQGDEFFHYWVNRDGQTVQCDDNGFWQVVSNETTTLPAKAMRRKANSHKKIAKAPATGSPRGLVILVNFKDVKYQSSNTQSAMKDMMNADNYTYNGATGSVAKYFADQSDGQYTPIFDVVGPVTLPNYMSHYGGNSGYDDNDKLPGDMVVEACSIANALHNVDFTRYDNDYDGYVDFVYIIYAGQGEAAGGSENTIWPHAWDVYSAEYFGNCTYSESKRKFDERYIYQYACSAELNYNAERDGVGTIAHEFSHVIGMPDLYDIDYGQNYEDEMTPGGWHIMDSGSYNNEGKTPPNYTMYDKYYLGWKQPVNPGNTAQELTMLANQGYQLASSNSLLSATSTNTVYYIENRQNNGWDAALPGHGMLIWKIKYNQTAWVNNGPNDENGNLRYALVSASGNTKGIGTAADAFPGSNWKTSWTALSGKPLKDITENSGVVTLTYIDKPSTEEPDPEEPSTPSGTVVFVPSDFAAVTNAEFEIEKGGVTLHCSLGSITSDQFRFFKSETVTLSVGSGNITSVEFTCTTDNDAKYGPGSFAAQDGYSYSGKLGTWQGEAATITFQSKNNQVRSTQIVVTLSGSGSSEPDPEEPIDPEEPEVNTNITGLKYADALYYEYEGVCYYDLDLYKDYDYSLDEYVYPEVYMTIPAKSRTALNGTYDIVYVGYWMSKDEAIGFDYTPATVTIQHTDNNGNYSVKGSFVGTDGLTYTFDDTVNVWAIDYDTMEEITLDESEPTDPEDPTDPEEPTEPELTGTVTFDADVDKGNASEDSANQTPYTVSKDGITLEVTKGIIGTSNNEKHYRIYSGETLTITSSVGKIVSVEFTCAAKNDEKYGPGGFAVSTGDYSYSGAVGTWTGNAASVVFTAATAQVRATQIVVTIAGVTTGHENVEGVTTTAYKVMRDGQLLIIRNGNTYGVDGRELGK